MSEKKNSLVDTNLGRDDSFAYYNTFRKEVAGTDWDFLRDVADFLLFHWETVPIGNQSFFIINIPAIKNIMAESSQSYPSFLKMQFTWSLIYLLKCLESWETNGGNPH